VAYRALRALQARAERTGIAREREVPAPDLAPRPKSLDQGGKVDAATYVQAADRIAHGFLDIFALRGVQLGAPPRWNRDPKSGIEAPLAFGKLLDYRNPDVVGDIKYLWEPNRHLHLVTLAQAYALTGKRAYFDAIAEHLDREREERAEQKGRKGNGGRRVQKNAPFSHYEGGGGRE
jgi:hypothetical protein